MTNRILRKTSNTCLAVIREKQVKKTRGELVFAADRRISWGMSHCQIGVRPKVVKRNGVILAGTGTSYLCDLICELTPIQDIGKYEDGFSYVHNVLHPNIKRTIVDKGYGDKDGNLSLPEDMGAVILVGVQHELFELAVEGNYLSIDAINAPYAHGCGGHYALGSLKTTENLKISSEERLSLAIGVAAELSPGCDNRMDIIRESDDDTSSN